MKNKKRPASLILANFIKLKLTSNSRVNTFSSQCVQPLNSFLNISNESKRKKSHIYWRIHTKIFTKASAQNNVYVKKNIIQQKHVKQQ